MREVRGGTGGWAVYEERRGKEGRRGRRSEERIREGVVSEEEEGEGGDEGVNESSRGRREESSLEAGMEEEEGKGKGWKTVKAM